MFRIPVHIVTEEEEQQARETFARTIRYGCAIGMVLLGVCAVLLALSLGR
jgi:putative copper export protein